MFHLLPITLLKETMPKANHFRKQKQRQRWLPLLYLVLFSLAWIAPAAQAQGPGWDFEAGDAAYGVAISGDGSLQVVGSRNNRVIAFDPGGAILWEFQPQGTVWGVAVTEDGAKTAVASEATALFR